MSVVALIVTLFFAGFCLFVAFQGSVQSLKKFFADPVRTLVGLARTYEAPDARRVLSRVEESPLAAGPLPLSTPPAPATVEPALASPGPPAVTIKPHANPHERACPYCKDAISDRTVHIECASCAAWHHATCFEENGGCSVFGCREQKGRGVAGTRVGS